MSYDRRIAALAQELVCAQKSKGQFSETESEYRAFCESLPVLLRTAGLLQTATFLEAKHDHPHGTVAEHLNKQLRALQHISQTETIAAAAASPTRVSTAQYRLLTQITARVAYWHKRMAQAHLRTKKEGAGQ